VFQPIFNVDGAATSIVDAKEMPQLRCRSSGYVRNSNRLSNRILIRLNWFFFPLGFVSVPRVVSGLT
jgi:hypothetical protein